jgi:Sulfotransferase domain
VRIVINGPPKQGNRWLKCLLSTVYELKVLTGSHTPFTRPEQWRAWIAAGGWEDGTIFHQHNRYSRRLVQIIEAVPAQLVTIVRDPYDAFVSYYYWVQDRAENEPEKSRVRPRNQVIGKPLDDPAVLAFLAGDYGVNIVRANEWVHCKESAVIRYEALHADPVAALRALTDQIGPVALDRVEAAVEECRAENMRQRSEKMARHVRSATVGDSKARLTEPHLAVFREHYADLIRSLGYEVR